MDNLKCPMCGGDVKIYNADDGDIHGKYVTCSYQSASPDIIAELRIKLQNVGRACDQYRAHIVDQRATIAAITAQRDSLLAAVKELESRRR